MKSKSEDPWTKEEQLCLALVALVFMLPILISLALGVWDDYDRIESCKAEPRSIACTGWYN